MTTRDDRQAMLARTAILFGAGGQESAPAHLDLSPIAPASTVLALGTTARRAARFYGQATGRKVVEATRDAPIDNVSDVDVVVADWSCVTIAFYERVYDYSLRSRPVGLILAASEESLLLQAEIRAAALRFSRVAAPATSTMLCSGWPIAMRSENNICYVGQEARVADVRSALATPSAVVGIHDHSDGVDAKLPGGAVLCSQITRSPVGRHLAECNCELTEYCHRLRVPTLEARQSEALVNPLEIQARILLLWSCWVALASDTSVAPNGALLEQLLESPTIGAVLAPWELAFVTSADMLAFSSLLYSGCTLAEAWRVLHAESQAARLNVQRFLIFGDPALRVVQPNYQAPLSNTAWRFGQKQSSPPSTPTQFDEIDWMRQQVQRIATAKRVPEEAIVRCTSALANYSVNTGWSGSDQEILLYSFLSHHISLSAHWFEDDITVAKVDIRSSCFTCGRAGDVYALSGPHRWQASCTACNVVYADVPAHSRLISGAFTIVGGHIDFQLGDKVDPDPVALTLRNSLDHTRMWLIDSGTLPPIGQMPLGRSWMSVHFFLGPGLYCYSRMLDNRRTAGSALRSASL